jgi:hypothetical protein
MACRLDDRTNLAHARHSTGRHGERGVPVGIAQKAAQAAHENSYEDCLDFTIELQARRDLLVEELAGLPVGVPAGVWLFMLRVENAREVLKALMRKGSMSLRWTDGEKRMGLSSSE